MTDSFEARLDVALAAMSKRRAIGLALCAASLVFAVLLSIVLTDRFFFGLAWLPIALTLATWVVRKTNSLGPLTQLRGGTPEHWLPSTTHHVIVATPNELIAGAVSAKFDRHSHHRVETVAYDEEAHAIVINVRSIINDRGSEHEYDERTVAKLEPSVTPDQAMAFAKLALTRSAR